jgi:plasmid stabilization system protein ParE
MSYQIRIMDAAKAEMRGIYAYIAEDLNNPIAAERRISLIEEAIHSLKENPTRFPLVRDEYLASKGYRLVVVKNHIVFFIVREQLHAVSVMRVMYGRRDWMRLLRMDDTEEDLDAN